MKTTPIHTKVELFCECPYCHEYCDEITNNSLLDKWEPKTTLTCHSCKKIFVLGKVSQ